MSSYTERRNQEKGTRSQASKDQQLQEEIAEKRVFRMEADKEEHFAVAEDHQTTRFWRLSQIVRNLKGFCRAANLPYTEKTTTINSDHVQDYLRQNNRKPARS